jgi:enterochelin esterase-like enzyme
VSRSRSAGMVGRDARRIEALRPEELDAFIAGQRFPLVDGRRATFVFRGDADEVHLRHWVFGLPSSVPFVRHRSTDLWYLVMDLPERSRVEYKLDVVRGGNHRWIRDPLNPALAHDPFGANSVVYGAGYERPDWTLEDSEARQGELHEMLVRHSAFGDTRTVRVYLPARFRRTRRYPLLLVHDGDDYLRFAGLKVVLDNLIHRLEIPPLIVALTSARDRMSEYTANEVHARFLAEDVVPRMQRLFPIDARPEARCLLGASLGAVASLHAAWMRPSFFGRLLLQSGSFAFTDIGDNKRGPVFEPIVGMVNAFREEHRKVADKVFVSCGMYESLIYENRSLVPHLQSAGMEVRYVEARDGHNWENWRDRLREGLSFLFPGPLLFVYE